MVLHNACPANAASDIDANRRPTSVASNDAAGCMPTECSERSHSVVEVVGDLGGKGSRSWSGVIDDLGAREKDSVGRYRVRGARPRRSLVSLEA
jgi:hypothetical protein